VGRYARRCLDRVTPPGSERHIGEILHPSPASPAANRDWEATVRDQWRLQGLPGGCPV
jgi:single-strand selective monofunctional uracil DNA glycosylase